MAITLSVCLITYNRAKFLELVLKDIFRPNFFDVSFEVIVCDNHSTDDTAEVVSGFMKRHPEIRYVRQKTNVGAINNLHHAYRLARGKYSVYLADDDRLIPQGLAETIRYMDAHPDVVACHAPWEMWDDVNRQSYGRFYQMPEERVFGKSDAIDLFNMIVGEHIFPEICVYRTAPMQRLMTIPFKAYWAFVHLAHCLDFGKVAFLPTPFYRSVVTHAVSRDRMQEGHMGVVMELDNYRAGLEYFALKAYRHVGKATVPPDVVELLQQMIQNFMVVRLAVAIRILESIGNYRGAYEYMARQQANGILPNESEIGRKNLATRAAIQSVFEIFDSSANLDEIILFNIDPADHFSELLRETRPAVPIRSITGEKAPIIPRPECCLALIASAEHLGLFIDAGYLPGMVIAKPDLLRLFEA